MTVTKADLIEKVVALGVTEKTARQTVQIIIDEIVEGLKKGEKVQLSGFGSFNVKSRNARVGRNPQTGAVVNIPAKKVPVFKSSEQLKEVLQ